MPGKRYDKKQMIAVLPILLFAAVLCLKLGEFRELYYSSQHDLRAYIACAHNIRAERDIYTTHHVSIPEDPSLTEDVPQYLYPPLLGYLFLPVTFISYDQFKPIWFLLNFFFIGHGCYLLARLLFRNGLARSAPLVLLALAFSSDTFDWLLKTAQIDGFVLYLIIVSYVLFERSAFALSALLLTLACWIKVTPALLLIYLMRQGDRRFFGYAVGFGLSLGLLQAVLLPRAFVDFFLEVIPHGMPDPVGLFTSQSLYSLVYSTIGPGGLKLITGTTGMSVVLLLPKTLILVCFALLLRQRCTDSTVRYLGFAACCGMTLLLTDLTWIMRFVWLIIPLSAILLALLEKRFPPGRLKVLAVISIVLFVGRLAYLGGAVLSASICTALCVVLALQRGSVIASIGE